MFAFSDVIIGHHHMDNGNSKIAIIESLQHCSRVTINVPLSIQKSVFPKSVSSSIYSSFISVFLVNKYLIHPQMSKYLF